MRPIDFLYKMGQGPKPSAGPWHPEDNAFAPATDPRLIHDFMALGKEADDESRGIGVVQFRGGARPELSPEETEELASVRPQKAGNPIVNNPYHSLVGPSTKFGRQAARRNLISPNLRQYFPFLGSR